MSFLHSLRRLAEPLDNCVYMVYRFCRLSGVAVSRTFIRQQLERHPDYPSLLAVTDVLNELNMENVSLRVSVDQLEQLSPPFMAHLMVNGDDYFTIVSHASEQVGYIDPVSDRYVMAGRDQFAKIFTGFVLLADGEAGIPEKDFALRVREERLQLLSFGVPVVLVLLGALTLSCLTFAMTGFARWAPVSYFLLGLVGAAISALLVWYDVDRHNPMLQKVCAAGKQVDCHEVLDTAQSSLFGIKWSVIGFAYFSGILVYLAAAGMGALAIAETLGWFSVAAFPYTVFSLYFQARVARKWCLLCLAVQGVLVLQCVAAFYAGFPQRFPSTAPGIAAVLGVVLPMLLILVLLHVLVVNSRQMREARSLKLELYRLKHRPEVFNALLSKQQGTRRPPRDMGIRIGNPDARHTIIKVCNPFCGPCARAHALIDELIRHHPAFCVQIIFTASTNDYRTGPVRHLMAIAERGDPVQTQRALDDWYGSRDKDYEAFAARYPMNGELLQQDHKIQSMYDWCKEEQIRVTPTMFISDSQTTASDAMYQLPDNYGIADLKYFFSFKLE